MASELVYEGYVKLADSTVISLQCYRGDCHECPMEAAGDEVGSGCVLDGYACEHGCGHGPWAERQVSAPPRIDSVDQDGVQLTRAQLSDWAGLGRDLSDDELEQLEECIPLSSIPDAIHTIVTEALGLTGNIEV